MNTRSVEILVGLFMALFLGALLVLAMKVSNLTNFTTGPGYTVTASFDNIGGLKNGAPVSAGGVRVGEVTSIVYDQKQYEAKITMNIQAEYTDFPLDTTASIYTSGLLGDQYIGLEPGADIDFLKDGDEITITQSALVLERLIGQVLFSRSGEQ